MLIFINFKRESTLMTISFYNIIKLKPIDIFLKTVKTMKIVKN